MEHGDFSWTVLHDFCFTYAGAEWVSACLADSLGGVSIEAIAGTRSVLSRLGANASLTFPWMSRRMTKLLSPMLPALLDRVEPVEGNALASSYAFAHHRPVRGKLIVYCHTPLRQIWSGYETYSAEYPWLTRSALRVLAPLLRRWDLAASRRAASYIATSRAVRDRIWRYYHLSDVPIIAPPIDDRVFNLDSASNRSADYVWVGRIVEPYKRLSLLVEVFRDLADQRLIVIGDGPDRALLEAYASSNVLFMGELPRPEVADWYRSARAVLFPSEDDFGLVPVEAMACGAPVVAYAYGGATDTVKEGYSGAFFREATIESVVAALRRLEGYDLDPREIAMSARTHGLQNFYDAISNHVNAVTG